MPDGDRDLSPAGTFNDLLARVEAAMDAQRRFVSDASLLSSKGPVAATRSCSRPPGLSGSRPVCLLSDLANENEQGIVDDLLALARQDEGRLKAQSGLPGLCELIYGEVSSLETQRRVP